MDHWPSGRFQSCSLWFSMHCWWDLIRSKQLSSVSYVAWKCLLDFLVIVIQLTYIYIYIYIYIHHHHHHHQVTLTTQISLTLSLFLSLSIYIYIYTYIYIYIYIYIFASVPIVHCFILCPYKVDVNKFLLVGQYW